MIYLISTNRAQWQSFAYEQALKYRPDKIVVLDNSADGIKEWSEVEHYHIPNCKNVSQMFNWYLDEMKPDDDLLYMDDDVEIYPEAKEIMTKYLASGWDMIVPSGFHVECEEEIKYCCRPLKGCGSGWLVSKNVLNLGRFALDTKEGVYKYMQDLIRYGVNIKTIFRPLMKLHIHGKNEIWTKEMFNRIGV